MLAEIFTVMYFFPCTDSLKSYFSAFGAVSDVVVMREPMTKKPRYYLYSLLEVKFKLMLRMFGLSTELITKGKLATVLRFEC